MKALFLILCLLSCSIYASAQTRPLITESVDTVRDGYLRFDLGFEFIQDATYRLSGLEGDLSRLGVFSARPGMGERAEIQIFGTVQEFLNVERRVDAPNSDVVDFAGSSTSDFGDLFLATKFRLVEETDGLPGIGFRFGAKLPNSSNESGLGTDETDFFAALLFKRSFKSLQLISTLGIAVLGDPVSPASQDDLLTYGFALVVPFNPRTELVADLYGRAGAGGIGTEEQARLRLGGRIGAAGVHWDLGFLVGLRDTDPCTGIIFGVSRDFDHGFW